MQSFETWAYFQTLFGDTQKVSRRFEVFEPHPQEGTYTQESFTEKSSVGQFPCYPKTLDNCHPWRDKYNFLYTGNYKLGKLEMRLFGEPKEQLNKMLIFIYS